MNDSERIQLLGQQFDKLVVEFSRLKDHFYKHSHTNAGELVQKINL